MPYKIAPISLAPKKESNTMGDVFVEQEESAKESIAGKLFILAELESKNPRHEKIIHFLIAKIRQNYYHNEKIVLEDNLADINLESILQATLSKTNQELEEFFYEEKIKLPKSKINIIAGVIHENNIFFSLSGKNNAFLLAKKMRAKDEYYQIVDIADQAEGESAKTGGKIFSDIISGSLPEDSYCVFTNEALPEYLSREHLKKLITTLPPLSAAAQIRNELAKINFYTQFLGIIIKYSSNITSLKKEDYLPVEIVGNRAGPISLEHIERNTEKVMGGGDIGFRKFGNSIFDAFAGAVKKIAPSKKGALTLREKIILKKRPDYLSSIKKTILFLKDGFYFLFLSIPGKISSITEKVRQEGLKNFLIRLIKKPFIWFQSLKPVSRIALVIFLASAAILAYNLVASYNQSLQIAEEKKFQETIDSIEQKQNQIESNLIYQNEAKTVELLDEIKTLLAGLGQESSQSDKYQALLARYQEQLQKVKHEVKIDSPRQVADFSQLGAGQIANITVNPAAPEILYAGDLGSKSIFSVKKDGTDAKLMPTTDNFPYPDFSCADNQNENIYYLGGNSFATLNAKTAQAQASEIFLKSTIDQVSAIDTYNQRLYTLVPSQNQIYRYRQKGEAFDLDKSWVEQATDLSNAADMAIDGNIFVLEKTGSVIKMTGGAKDNGFKLGAAAPALEEPKKIDISLEAEGFIYILEPKNKRLTVFEKKSGNFINQYTSDAFDDLKDFAIDEASKKAYLLNGNKVYEIDL